LVGGRAGGRAVVERRALVEERRLGRVEVFGGRVLLERSPAEADDAAAQVRDRKDDAFAEAVERQREVVDGGQQAGRGQALHRHLLRAQVLLEGEALGGRVAEAELELGRRIDAAIRQVPAGAGAGARRQRRLEEFGGELQDVVQRLAPLLARL